jgi:hypothetical protein
VAYGIDANDPFFSCVSRQHIEINVRDEQVFARACQSATVGRCHVEVQAPGSATVCSLSDQFTPLAVGSLVILGTQPALGFSERPTFVLDGPVHASNNHAQTQVVVLDETVSEDLDPARTQYVAESEE